MRRLHATLVTGGLAMLLATAGSALAEDVVSERDDTTVTPAEETPVKGVASRRPKAVEEITVRARRRDETLQETPVSITSFGPTDLIDRNITELQDIGQYVPNLQFDESVGAQDDARIYLRGIGNGDSIITDEAGVGTVVDDVFLPRAAGVLQALSDVANIEVLSGPQATLYGKNTVGGVVRVTSNKPGWEREGRANARYSAGNAFRTNLIYNLPVVDDLLALRVNLANRYDRGAVDNKGPGRDRLSQTRSIDAVVQVLFTPSEDLEFLLKLDRGYSNGSGTVAKCKLGAGISDGPNDSINGRLFGPQGLLGSFDAACLASGATDFDEVSADGGQESDLDTYTTSLVANWSPTPSLQVKSVTAWSRNLTDRAQDADATSLPLSNVSAFERSDSSQDAISQELTLSGEAMSGRVNWITGLYFLKEKNQDDSRDDSDSALRLVGPQTFLFGGTFFDLPKTSASPLNLGPVPVQLLDTVPAMNIRDLAGNVVDLPLLRLTNGAGPCLQALQRVTILVEREGMPPLPVGTTPCIRQVSPFRTVTTRKSDQFSYAAYGQVDFDINDQWELSLGARYTHERKRVDRLTSVFEDDIPLVQELATFRRGNNLNIFERSARFGRFSPSASIAYKPTDDWNIYATWSRGFKSGGFNGRGVGDANEIVDYDEELVTNYEIGIKGNLGEKARITMAYFHTNYDQIQLIQVRLDPDTFRPLVETDNFGSAAINGFEFSIAANPIPELSITANLGITAGRYEKISQIPGTLLPVDPNNRLTGTPTYTGSIAASYLASLGSLGDLRTNLTWNHTGSKANDTANVSFSGKRGILGASFSLELPNGTTRITLGGSNLLDREYLANALSVGRNDFEFFGRGRELYLEVAQEF